jgi:hypothetical protein
MPQIFPPSANSFTRLIIGVAVGLVPLATGLVVAVNTSSWVTEVNVARAQPLQFSHERHVAGNGLDCRYCHTNVERSAFAGIPPTATCMNCHSQVWSTSPYLEPVRASLRAGTPLEWRRVHDLPDFVYFNHAAHVNKGVGCATCHGRVDRMPLVSAQQTLQMAWCLECHTRPERYVRPRADVFRMDYEPPPDQATLGAALVAEYRIQRLTDCSTCHR